MEKCLPIYFYLMFSLYLYFFIFIFIYVLFIFIFLYIYILTAFLADFDSMPLELKLQYFDHLI